MKNKPFHFRYVNEIVGVFVLLVVVLLVAAVVVAGRAQGWFEPTHQLPIDFPPEGSLDLQVGSPVQILETTVGRVLDIEVDTDGFMRAVLLIKGDFYQFVRTDSRVTVKRKFGVFGDAFVDIAKGTGPELPEGAGLVASREVDIVAVALDMINQLRDASLVLLASSAKLLDEAVGFTEDLRDQEGSFMMAVAHLESIIHQIEQGQGPVGRFVTDEATAKNVDRIMTEFTASMVDLQQILEDVRQLTAEFPEMAEVLGDEVNDLPGTVLITQEAIREAERLIVGVQNHWLFEKYVPEDDGSPLIPVHAIPRSLPAKVPSSPVEEIQP